MGRCSVAGGIVHPDLARGNAFGTNDSPRSEAKWEPCTKCIIKFWVQNVSVTINHTAMDFNRSSVLKLAVMDIAPKKSTADYC